MMRKALSGEGMTTNGARLILFDIDGTLLSAGRAARDSILAALGSVLGWEGSADGNDFSGKTDPQILRELVAESVGADRFDRTLAEVLDRYVEELRRRLRPETVVPKPGVPELLERLAREPGVVLGLLTGNIERGARLKLEPPGFNRFFPFGAFGDDSADRYCLPAVAVARALERTGRNSPAHPSSSSAIRCTTSDAGDPSAPGPSRWPPDRRRRRGSPPNGRTRFSRTSPTSTRRPRRSCGDRSRGSSVSRDGCTGALLCGVLAGPARALHGLLAGSLRGAARRPPLDRSPRGLAGGGGHLRVSFPPGIRGGGGPGDR
jgi:phosphoglycolate phosphatase-like HAD superfamily hydrolase